MRTLGLWPHVTVRYSVEAIDSNPDERVRNDAQILPVRLVFVIIFDHLIEVMVGFQVILRDSLTARIHLAEFPTRKILPALSRIGQRRRRRIRVASFQIGKARAQSLIGIGEIPWDLR